MTYIWFAEPQKYKTVKLSNVYMCKSITCNDIMRALEGMELYEWKRHLSYVLSEAVLKAFDTQENVADISKMFSCNLFGVDEFGEHTRKQEEIIEILMKKLFKKESETSETLTVSIKLGGISN